VIKKPISSYIDDSDDELNLLGSRFIRALGAENERTVIRRTRHVDPMDIVHHRQKPRPVRDRTY